MTSSTAAFVRACKPDYRETEVAIAGSPNGAASHSRNDELRSSTARHARGKALLQEREQVKTRHTAHRLRKSSLPVQCAFNTTHAPCLAKQGVCETGGTAHPCALILFIAAALVILENLLLILILPLLGGIVEVALLHSAHTHAGLDVSACRAGDP